MSRAPRVTAREALRALQRDGWTVRRQSRGSHVQSTHPTKLGRVTVPMHAGVILQPKTLTTILRQAGLTLDEFRKLL
jgi:predicted RNA binding protein YcfA (HicA-like mRNA interferase family)